MAIPVSNPPPRYEPPTTPVRDEAPREPGSPSVRGPRDVGPVGRGCIMVVGLATALACIASVGLAVSCRGILQAGESEGARRIAVSYRAAAAQTGQTASYAADLDTLEQLGNSGHLSILALAILNNRYNDAIANDGVIDADELHHGMELVHDVVVSQGSIDVDRYPDAR